jgi:hypothetical protein
MDSLQIYIGILLRMGVVHMPHYCMYWSSEFRYNTIADYMSRNEFEDIGRFIHFNDNTELATKHKDPDYDPLFKIRPILERLRQHCLLVAPEQRQSVDEQTIPFKGKNRLRQYLPNKPKKWGFKVMARCCAQTGFTHDFSVYEGKAAQLAEGERAGYQPADFVILLCKTLPQHKNYVIYFDNWFNFLDLQLKDMGFLSIGTLRANRHRRCTLKSQSELCKARRGSYDAKVDANSGLCIVHWFDNRAVQVSSTHIGIKPAKMVKRWDKARKFTEVPCPAAVAKYNSHMGGVDLFDMLAAMYRVDHKNRKWYRRVFYWILNVTCVNSWILYRRHCHQNGVPQKDVMDLLAFVAKIALCLIMCNKPAALPERKRGRPPLAANRHDVENDEVPEDEPRQKRAVNVAPLLEVRLDTIGHLPQHKSTKGRCRHCKTSIMRIIMFQMQCLFVSDC